jgi:hypothetical protein
LLFVAGSQNPLCVDKFCYSRFVFSREPTSSKVFLYQKLTLLQALLIDSLKMPQYNDDNDDCSQSGLLFKGWPKFIFTGGEMDGLRRASFMQQTKKTIS